MSEAEKKNEQSLPERKPGAATPESVDAIPTDRLPPVLVPFVEMGQGLISAHREEIAAKERIALRRIDTSHKETLSEHRFILWATIGAFLLGASVAVASFVVGKPEFGVQVTGMTLTGVFGFLAGRASKGSGRSADQQVGTE